MALGGHVSHRSVTHSPLGLRRSRAGGRNASHACFWARAALCRTGVESTRQRGTCRPSHQLVSSFGRPGSQRRNSSSMVRCAQAQTSRANLHRGRHSDRVTRRGDFTLAIVRRCLDAHHLLSVRPQPALTTALRGAGFSGWPKPFSTSFSVLHRALAPKMAGPYSPTPFARCTLEKAIRGNLKVSFRSTPRSMELSCEGGKSLRHRNRRRFLADATGAAAGMFLWPKVGIPFADLDAPDMHFPSAGRERIAIASYPFRDFVAARDDKSGSGKMELKYFAAHVTAKFNIKKIEPWSAHFRSLEKPYLQELRAAVAEAHGAIVNIAVDGEHSPYAADPAEREEAIAFSKQWIDAALVIGSPSLRTNIPPAKDSKPDVERTAQSLKLVAEYGAAKNVIVNLEND